MGRESDSLLFCLSRGRVKGHEMAFLKRILRPEYVFLALFVPLGLMASTLYPVGAGFDEEAHVARIDQLARGGIVAPEVDRADIDYRFYLDSSSEDPLYGGAVDRSLAELTFKGDKVFIVDKQRVYDFPTWTTPDLSSEVAYGEEDAVIPFSNAAINTPVTYLPQVLVFSVTRLFVHDPYALIVLMRLSQMLAMAVVMFFSIRLVPIGKWPLAVVGLLPINIMLNAGVTGDTMCIVCCVGFLVALLRLLLEKPSSARRSWIVLVATIVCLGLVKMSYLPLMLLAALIPLVRKEYRTRRCYAMIGGAWLASVVLFGAWYMLAVSGVNTGAMFKAEVHPSEQMAFILQHPLVYGKLMLNLFLQSNFFQLANYAYLEAHDVPVFGATWLSVILFVVSLALKDDREVSVKMPLKTAMLVACGIVAALLVVLALIALALYLQFTAVGLGEIQGVQTRYFLPILPFFLVALLVPYRQSIDPYVKKPTSLAVPGACVMTGLELFSALVIAYNFVRALF